MQIIQKLLVYFVQNLSYNVLIIILLTDIHESFFTFTVRHWQVKVVATAIFKRSWQVQTLNFLFRIQNFVEFHI